MHLFVQYYVQMATNLQLDEKLVSKALKIGKQSTKKAVVNEALKEYVQRRQQSKIMDLFGKIDYTPSYNYKHQRK